MTLFCVLGDAHLDVVVCPDGPVARGDRHARAHLGRGRRPGRQRGGLDQRARRAGPADRGPRHRPGRPAWWPADLAARGVETCRPGAGRARPAWWCRCPSSGTSRSMLTDRGVGPRLTADALDDGWLAGCGLAAPARPTAWPATRSAGPRWPRPAQVPRLSVDLSSTALLHEYGAARFRAPARPAPARGRVRHRGRGGADRRPARHRAGGEAGRPRRAGRGHRAPGACRWTRWTRPGRATRSPPATWSAGSAWAWPRRPGR